MVPISLSGSGFLEVFSLRCLSCMARVGRALKVIFVRLRDGGLIKESGVGGGVGLKVENERVRLLRAA